MIKKTNFQTEEYQQLPKNLKNHSYSQISSTYDTETVTFEFI